MHMSKRIVFAAMALLLFAAAPTLAQSEKKCEPDKPKCGSKAEAKTSCADRKVGQDAEVSAKEDVGCSHEQGTEDKCGDVNCAGDLVCFKGTDLPRIAYQIKDQRLSCPRAAAKAAKAEKADIKYVVADKVYSDKTEALAAHAEVLDGFLNDMLTVKYVVGDTCVGCPNAAKAMAEKEGKKVGYRVASFDFADRAAAETAVKMAREASAKVEMKMLVGDETFDCPVHAAQTAKEQGKDVQYCVGKMKTASEPAARVELAVERIKAALTACEECGGKQIASA
jgi:hypothetical protein